MTVLFVGDVHLKSARVLPAVDRAVAMTGAVGVVFLGDVCDDWDATARQAVAAVRMFADWVRARRAAGLDVTVLTGNHDLPYLARPRSYAAHWFRHEADGFKPRAHEGVHEALKPLDMRLAWRRGRVLATHAGVTADWAAWAGLSGEPEADLDRMPHRILFDMAGPARPLRAIARLGGPDGAGGRSVGRLDPGGRAHARADRHERRKPLVLRYVDGWGRVDAPAFRRRLVRARPAVAGTHRA